MRMEETLHGYMAQTDGSWTQVCIKVNAVIYLRSPFPAYPQDHSSSWFRFRIVMVEAESLGMVETAVTECNIGSTDQLVEGVFTVGVGFNFGGMVADPWTVSPSVLEEVRSAFMVMDNSFWDEAMEHELTFSRETEEHFSVTLRPGQRVAVVQLVGTYGPYIVRAPTNVMYSSQNC